MGVTLKESKEKYIQEAGAALKPNFDMFTKCSFDELYKQGQDFWEITYYNFDEGEQGTVYLEYMEAQKLLFKIDVYNRFIKEQESKKIEKMNPIKAFVYKKGKIIGKNIGIGINYKIRSPKKESDGYKPEVMEIKY